MLDFSAMKSAEVTSAQTGDSRDECAAPPKTGTSVRRLHDLADFGKCAIRRFAASPISGRRISRLPRARRNRGGTFSRETRLPDLGEPLKCPNQGSPISARPGIARTEAPRFRRSQLSPETRLPGFGETAVRPFAVSPKPRLRLRSRLRPAGTGKPPRTLSPIELGAEERLGLVTIAPHLVADHRDHRREHQDHQTGRHADAVGRGA
jgi:hypothetical protein